MKIISTRTALNNRKQYEKSELLRFVKTVNGIKFDNNHSLPGRGYYFSKDFDLDQKTNLHKYLCGMFKCNLNEEDIIRFKEAYNKEREENK